jgi:hypothetical protein
VLYKDVISFCYLITDYPRSRVVVQIVHRHISSTV